MNLTAGSKFTIRPGSILPVILLDKSYWANFWLNFKKNYNLNKIFKLYL
jgi:hypothetical protein